MQVVYNGDELATQSDKNISSTFNSKTLSTDAATEAFDEPLTKAKAKTIAESYLKL